MRKINIKHLLAILFIATTISCTKESGDISKKQYSKVAYITNYGGFKKANGEVSTLDISKSEMNNNSYQESNGVEFAANISSMSIYKDVAYIVSNAGDKINVVDAATLEAIGNPISKDIISPRFFYASNGIGYVSCWGEVKDYSVYANSYIAKIDLTTKKVLKKIALPGAPEGMIIKGGKLYISSSVTNKVTVLDLKTEALKEIEVSAIPQHFVEDANGNIWVSLVSKYSSPFEASELGFSIIDTKTDKVISTINFPNIKGNGYLCISSDKKKIYVLGGGNYLDGVEQTGVYSIDVETKILEKGAVISGSNFSGLDVNPENGDVYVLITPDYTSAGQLKIYNSKFVYLREYEVGINPQHIIFYDVEK